MRALYIAGPMSGLADFGYAAFKDAAARARAKWPGVLVFSPPELNEKDFGGRTDLPHCTYMLHDLPRVLESDYVMLLPGWRESTGARLEALVAVATGKKFVDGLTLEPIEAPTMGSVVLEPPGSPQNILDEAKAIVHGDRQKDYGTPRQNFARIAAIWSAVLGQEVTPTQVGLCMVGLKIARLANGYKRDSVVDIAGYGATIEMIEEGP